MSLRNETEIQKVTTGAAHTRRFMRRHSCWKEEEEEEWMFICVWPRSPSRPTMRHSTTATNCYRKGIERLEFMKSEEIKYTNTDGKMVSGQLMNLDVSYI